ncbi:bifunctional metallophosphatase/5'-nucleotidase [Paenibacillus abyssi]|uniref:Bifunctional metallophosphatase/5'-nucleotidase n=1 Tax=Paenibacillus abyssi TaxID=1340531 RepID=A0A917LIE7_9BACL|nr:bifunctional UDP-sugar hydrolase/5'-nucleotidase [Paenibacillus abyssi]GGG26636.1 bifunctional metallophosphatase/5'-nucleotidase [Paenibacillus abyssi]
MKYKHDLSSHVVLLHSNDIHSRLEQASKISTYITEERRMVGSDRLLVVDCGDHMDRMRMETEGSDGRVNIELMNEAGYEAAAIGNNEGLTYSKEELERAYRSYARFPALCANLFDRESGELPEWLLPRLIINKNGWRIGLTSVTAQYDSFYSLLGWEARDPFAAAAEQIEWLRPRVDVVVVVSHLGLSMDERMAEQIGGIDLILGAHTHHLLLEPIMIGDTTICAAGKFGEHLGRVEIAMDPISERPVFRASCVPMAAYAEDPEAAAIISGFRETGERRMSRVIARLDAPLPVQSERESPLGNLLAAGLRRWTDAEIGIVNAGQLLGGLAQGDVTEAQLHALCPSPINPCRMLLSGRHIRIALEEALLPEFVEMPIRGFGFRGLVLGTLAVDGMEIVYNPELPAYGKIVDMKVAGAPFDEDRSYIVGTIDMFTFGAGYKSLKEGREISYCLPEFIRNVLAEQLIDQAAVKGASVSRWSIG